MEERELLKINLERKKEEIEKESLHIHDDECNQIVIDLGTKIDSIVYKDNFLDDKVIKLINKAIEKSKEKFEEEWIKYLREKGLEF